MDKVTKIIDLAERGIPQALTRFNDGEVGIILNKDFIAARGDQKGSVELQIALLDAIKHEQKNYWKGYPCHVCMKKYYDKVKEAGMINDKYKYNTCAVVNTNRNRTYFKTGLENALKGKQVIWVSGNDQVLDKLDFNIVEHFMFEKKDSWAHYSIILQECLRMVRPHRVFLFSCGPTARVLVKTLFQMRPDATFLDLGSTYDPYTRNVSHKCHRGKLKKCKGCN